MPYLLSGCQVILMLILLIAAIGKLAYPQQFFTALRVSVVPRPLIFSLALLTVVAELELALNLIFSTRWFLPLTFVGTFLLLGVFTFWLVSVYRRKLNVQCGCFGGNTSSVDKGSIIRNAVLMGIAVLGFLFSLKTTSIFPSFSLWTLIPVVIFAAIALFVLLRQHAALQPTNIRPSFASAQPATISSDDLVQVEQ